MSLLGQEPAVFFTSTRKFERQLVNLLNRVARDIVRSNDWQALVRVNTITGDGVVGSFPLPADYNRMLVNTDVQDPDNWAWGYRHILDINEFLNDQAYGWQGWPGGWIIFDNRMHFSPSPSGQARFPYVSSNYALSNAAVPKPAFTADDDTFVLPEELLTQALIWRWRENEKLDSTADQEVFVKMFNEYATKDRGSVTLRVGGFRWANAFSGRGIRRAYPW